MGTTGFGEVADGARVGERSGIPAITSGKKHSGKFPESLPSLMGESSITLSTGRGSLRQELLEEDVRVLFGRRPKTCMMRIAFSRPVRAGF